jgi:hypothetical protein
MNPLLGNQEVGGPMPFPDGGQMRNVWRGVFGNITNQGTQRDETVCLGAIDMDESFLDLDGWDNLTNPFHHSIDSMPVDTEERHGFQNIWLNHLAHLGCNKRETIC